MTKDPTKDPEFQKVVQAFLSAKPRLHKQGAAKRSKKRHKRGTKKEG